jgi:MtN3 and saliva related transmembrane protein
LEEFRVRHRARLPSCAKHGTFRPSLKLGKTVQQVTILGFVAAFLTTAAFLPQVIHTIRTRSTHDISLRMYVMYSTGLFLWTVYGWMIHDMPLLISNAFTFLLAATILSLKLRHG